MSKLSISEVGAGRLEAAVALFDAQLREHEIIQPLDALRSAAEAVVADPRHGFILLAESDAHPVGIAYAAAHLSVEHGGTIGWLEELYVTPAHRGAGIGSSLLARVITHAKELHWRALELEVVAGHERVAALYTRHEFCRVSRHRFRHLVSE